MPLKTLHESPFRAQKKVPNYDGNWLATSEPKISGKTMKWSGKRSFDDKAASGQGLNLKLGLPDIGLYFQFYSHNLGVKHYGKTEIIDMKLNDGSMPVYT